MSKKKIASVVEELLALKLEEMDLLLWNVEFVKEAKDWFLRVYLDKKDSSQQGVSLDECEAISRFLSEKLDEEDLIEPNYFLEVSSPGIERSLMEKWHYEASLGKLVNLKLYKALDGKKNLEGTLKEVNGEKVTLDIDGQAISVGWEEIAKANIVFVF